jgi:imidazolonepropionase-like amidohydrolase
MTRVVIRNGRVLDVVAGEYHSGWSVRVEDGRIVEVAASVSTAGAEVVDAADRVVMPGLIDAHVHPMLSSLDVAALTHEPRTLLAQRARVALEAMLTRGFTTVRDNCGGDRGLVRATEEGLIRGPRLLVAGRALSQTGGHGDARAAGDLCAHNAGIVSRIADGVDEVRRAAREELRQGADHLKIMASGGVASPTDEVWMLQYSVEEMVAAVQEATARGTYVAAHAYTAEAITRAVEAGARSIEHGNLIDAPAATLMASRGAFLVPTLIAYDKIAQYGEELGMPADQLRKIGDVIDAGLGSLKIARDAGVKVGFGTDLLGEIQRYQSDELRIRSRAQDAIDIIRSATVVNAELLGLEGQVGVLQPGAHADVLIVDGDPLHDATVLAEVERLHLVMRAGEIAHARA